MFAIEDALIKIYFVRITQYNEDVHNIHAHSPLWTHICNLYPYEHFQRTEHQQIWRFPKSHWRLVDKIRPSCLSVGLHFIEKQPRKTFKVEKKTGPKRNTLCMATYGKI